MSRNNRILKYVDTDQPGIEIAPYFNPLLPKRDGNNVLILDVKDTSSLREMAKKDSLIENSRIDQIEEVDFVGDACNIGEVVANQNMEGSFNHIVSSHNFEHLPNPILFLRGCSVALAPRGILSMAVPDYRACFDFYRMPTRLADWLTAYHEERQAPNAATIFDSISMGSHYCRHGQKLPSSNLRSDDPAGYVPEKNLRIAYDTFQELNKNDSDYRDTHCSVFFPESLELLLRDLRFLGLINLEVIEVTQTVGHEFYVHLRNIGEESKLSESAFYEQRSSLLIAISQGIGTDPASNLTKYRRRIRASLRRFETRVVSASRRVVGDELIAKLSDKNKKLRGR